MVGGQGGGGQEGHSGVMFVITGQANKMQFYVEARKNVQYHPGPWGAEL